MTHSRLTLILLLASLLAPFPTALASGPAADGLALSGRTSLAGTGSLTLDGEGAVHYSDRHPPQGMALEAQEVVLEYAWEEGRAAGTPSQPNYYETVTDQGRSSTTVTNASVSVGAFQDDPQILAYPATGSSEVRASGTGDQTYGTLTRSYLTRVGVQPDGEATEDSQTVGFWYGPEPRWLSGSGNDEAHLDGDFSLFLNNLTVTAEQGGKTVWENWTGYQRERTGPAASSFERHLLKIHVTNGSLALAEDDGISVFGPELDVQANGIVTAEAATGRLDLGEASFAFDGQPLRMEGEGSFEVRESTTGSAEGLVLSVDESSRFDVHGGQRVDPGTADIGSLAGWRLWAPVSLLGLAVTGVLAYRAGYASQALEGWRSRRYTKWMTRGRELANGGDYNTAAPCFRRATRAQPVKGVAWYHLAIALIEDDRPREVIEVIDEARAGEAVIDELDFLDLEAQAARRVGDLERCKAAVAQLADGSPAMARTLVGELGLSEEVLGHELATRLSWEDDAGDGEGLPGYV